MKNSKNCKTHRIILPILFVLIILLMIPMTIVASAQEDSSFISNNRNELYNQIYEMSNGDPLSVSFGNLKSNGYHYYFEVTEDSFFAQYKTKDSSWLKIISFEYEYETDIVTSNFAQSGSSKYYAATATFNASDYVSVGSIVYKDATGANYGGMCIAFAKNFAEVAIPKINQKMMNEFDVSLYKIGFTSYSHTHFGGEATCSSYAVCTVCNKEYGELNEHVIEIQNKIYATCYEPGYTGDSFCTVCNKIVEYGEIDPIIEREAATGKYDFLKQYILKYGKNDAADNKYVYYSDIIYDANNNSVSVYARITYMDEFAQFRFLYTSGDGEDLTSIVMYINENGSNVALIEFAYEYLGLYANASAEVRDYEVGSNVYFVKTNDFPLSNDQIQDLCNSELQSAMLTWDLLLLSHLRSNVNMGDLGFVSYEEPSIRDHTHIWDDWTSADGTHSRTCLCGEIEASACAWNDGDIVTNPTCAVEGEEIYTCTVCSATKIESVSKTDDHNFDKWQSIDDETHKHICSMCSKEETADHAWNNGTVTTPPTFKDDGEKTYTCTDCSATKMETLAKTEDHNFDKWQSIDGETHKHICSVCLKEKFSVHTWDNGTVTAEPTTVSSGVLTYTCNDCGETKLESIDKLLPPTLPNDTNNESDRLSGGAVTGIAVGSTAVVGVGGFSLFWFVIKKKSWADLISVFKK